MEILYIDLDGVLVDFDKGLVDFYGEHDISDWDFQLNNICKRFPTIFDHLPEIKNAVKAVKELSKYYDIYFLSAPIACIPESYTSKRNWIKNKFGEWADERLILSHRKDLLKGKFLIDDSLRFGVPDFEGEHIHFGKDKFPDWKTITNYLIN